MGKYTKYSTDPEFISLLAKELDIIPEEAKVISKVFVECVRSCIVRNGVLNIRSLGFFHTKSRKAGKARNIRTGEEMVIPLTMRILFKPSHSIKQAVNERSKKIRREKIGY